jgi:hypothetical protein
MATDETSVDGEPVDTIKLADVRCEADLDRLDPDEMQKLRTSTVTAEEVVRFKLTTMAAHADLFEKVSEGMQEFANEVGAQLKAQAEAINAINAVLSGQPVPAPQAGGNRAQRRHPERGGAVDLGALKKRGG